MDQEYFEDKVVTLKTLTGYQRLREVFGFALLVIAIYLIIALFSFDQADASFSQTALNEPVRNVGGRFGAWLADVLFSVFGLVAYLLPFILLIHCWNVFKQRHLSVELDYFTLALRLIGFLALVLSACGLADLDFDDWYNFASGGILGSLMSYAVVPMFGHTGATLALLLIGALGFTLFTGWSWLTITEKIGIATVGLITFILNKVRKDDVSREEERNVEHRISHHNQVDHNDVLLAKHSDEPDEEYDEFYVPENQLAFDLDALQQSHSAEHTETPKSNIEFVAQYPTIETEPTISLRPSISEEEGDNVTLEKDDHISQLINSMSHLHKAEQNPTISVVEEPLAVQEIAIAQTPIQAIPVVPSDTMPSHDIQSTVIQPNKVENVAVEPSHTAEVLDYSFTQVPQESAMVQTSPLENRKNVTITQKPVEQQTQQSVQRPTFVPANRKEAPELPRPNPVRIPTRRELATQGLGLKPVKAQQYRENESNTAYGDEENDELLHRQFMEQQQARYGEDYQHDYDSSGYVSNTAEPIDLAPVAQEENAFVPNESVTISYDDSSAGQKTFNDASVNELLDKLEKQLLDEPRSESNLSVEPQPSYTTTNPGHQAPVTSLGITPAESHLTFEPVVSEPITSEPAAFEPVMPNPTVFEPAPEVVQPMIAQPVAVPTNTVTSSAGYQETHPEPEVEEEQPASSLDETLVHPFLMRNDVPLQKPTTPLPTLDLLTPPPASVEPVDMDELERTARLIEERLSDYRVKANVVGILPGPVVTLYELDLAPGVKAARISNLSRDLARALSAVAVRVVEVIPGRPYVGLELPNKRRQTVYVREVLDCQKFRDMASPLATVLGKDISGEPVVADLAKMPHVLVAGTTGSGKSVGVNAMIISMLYKATPDEVRFIMIDPKMLELSVYEGIPHLLTEVVTDMKDASNALRWCVGEMERRYKLMSALGVRNLAGYNERIQQAIDMGRPVPDPFWKPTDSMDMNCPTLEKLPYIVVIVDEFADLMMAVGKKVEELIARLAQKARAAGIHLVLATQRPSVDVITGLIKANIPSRIAFTVSSKIDSRTILDQGGAESLLGMGDMLYLGPNSSTPVRVHGAFVRDEEVHAVAQDWKARGKPQYIDSITSSADEGEGSFGLDGDEELDPLFDQAVAFVVEKRKSSISGVQRQFRIGYNRAARIVEQMEAQGIVSPPGHNGNREVLAPPSHQ